MSVIDDYLSTLSGDEKAILADIRKTVLKLVPTCTEVITYGMPGFKYKGKYLLSFAAFKDHLSLFPGAEPIEVFKSDLKDFVTSKGTIQFSLQQQIPHDLLEKIILSCVQRIDA